VLANNSDGWSCHRATAMTPRITTRLVQPTHDPGPIQRRHRGGVGAGRALTSPSE
jgi:hypothetical protein